MGTELQKYRKAAKQQGWRERPTKKGFQLIPPDPDRDPVQVHGTPSDHRVLKNLLSEMREVASCAPHHGEEDAVEWSVRVELGGPARELDPDVVSDMLEALEGYAAVASLGVRSFGVRLSVDEREALAAQSRALELVRAAGRGVGLSAWPVVGIGAASMDELADDLARPNAVALAGVAELAQILGVSKQRASELARSRTFPKPIMALASGPVWAVPAVDAFRKTWNRRPGPKPLGGRPGPGP